jgi:D-alanyl-D-alanine carboxypeptidase
VKAIQLLDRGFSSDTLSWLRASLGTVDSLAPIDASPPDLRDEMCNGKRHRPAADDDDIVAGNSGAENSGQALAFFSTGQTPSLKPSEILAAAPAPSEPIPVYTGPTRTGAALIATVAADTAAQEQAAARHRGKKTHVAAKRPAEAAPDDTAKQAKSTGKPVKHANAKPDAAAKTADKPATAKPKAVAKPAKPAPKSDAKSSNG